MQNFDTIIIGSGQAGTPLVFKLAANGKKVALIEKQYLGGTCLNVGCTPTKTYVASARRMWEVTHAEDLGIQVPSGAYADLKKIKTRKDLLIKKSVDGIMKGLEKNNNITYFKGEASFIGPKLIQVGEDQLKSDQIFINVGGHPYIPNGYENVPYLTSSTILDLEVIPEHLIIIGGSYIGLEFGQIFKRLGSKVTIVEQNKTIINKEDPELSAEVLKFLKADGIEFNLSSTCHGGNQNEDGSITLNMVSEIDGLVKINGTHVLLAVGRRPNTKNLNLEATGVVMNDRGYITVDDYLKTNIPGIYALGDCNGKGSFTHTAYNDYEIIVENLFDNKDRKVSDRILTYGLFVDPPLGRAGMTRSEALTKGHNVLLAKREMSRIARAKEKGETHGFMSIIIDADTKKILGASVLGTGGDEIISSILNIMYADVSYEVIRDSVQPHPTISELIPTMLESLTSITS